MRLAGLDCWPAPRVRLALAAQRLKIALAGMPVVSFQPGWDSCWVSSVCVVGPPADAAGAVECRMLGEGIDTCRWWGKRCHCSPAFAHLPHSEMPETERLARSTLGMPFMLDMTEHDVQRVAGALKRALRA